MPIAARIRIGRAAVGLELRRRERGLASDAPLRQLAASLGYPDVETLLVAVADHVLSAEEIAERLIQIVDAAPSGANLAEAAP